MARAVKLGWLTAPCTIQEPGVPGAKGVIRVRSLERKNGETTIIGTRPVPGELRKSEVRIAWPDSTYITVLSGSDHAS